MLNGIYRFKRIAQIKRYIRIEGYSKWKLLKGVDGNELKTGISIIKPFFDSSSFSQRSFHSRLLFFFNFFFILIHKMCVVILTRQKLRK